VSPLKGESESGETARGVALDRALGDVQGGGGVLNGQVVPEPEDDDSPLPDRQGPQGVEQSHPFRRVVLEQRGVGQDLYGALATPWSPRLVDDLAHQRCSHPAVNGYPVPGRVDVQGDQDRLHHVFGPVPVTAQQIRRTTERRSTGGDILAVLPFVSHNRKTEPLPLAVVMLAPPCGSNLDKPTRAAREAYPCAIRQTPARRRCQISGRGERAWRPRTQRPGAQPHGDDRKVWLR